MTRIPCPECGFSLYDYQERDWTEYICWKCGHYESNTPAFKSAPHIFKEMVRNNPHYFLRKFCTPTEFQQRNKTTDDSTEPNICIFQQLI